MSKITLTSDNKSYIVRRYVDHVAFRMSDTEIYDAFKDYLYREKIVYPLETLNAEINRHFPELLEDDISERIVGKGAEYAKTI